MQAWHEGMWHWHQHTRNPCRQKKSVEAASITRTENWRGCHCRQKRKKSQKNNLSPAGPSSSTTCVCFICQGRSRETVNLGLIGLYSNTRRCSSTNPHGAIPWSNLTGGCQQQHNLALKKGLNLLLHLCKSLKKASASHIICVQQRLCQNDFLFYHSVDGQLPSGFWASQYKSEWDSKKNERHPIVF